MKQEVLEKAIKLNDSIRCIDQVADFVSKHEKTVMMIQSGLGEFVPGVFFTKEVQEFLIYEVLPMYRSRLVDELDKL